MTARVEPLAWDSDFFGFPIGRVTLDDATPESLARIEDEARALGIACLYGSLEASAETTAYLVQRFGYRLVEVSQLFARPAGPFEARPTKSSVRRGTAEDIDQLDDAFTVLAPWSRFGADPRFGLDAARRMHRAWVERAAREPESRLFGVAEDDSGIVGVATYVREPVPRVDFMGVTKPGTGASQALMGMLMEWAGDNPTEAGPSAARNIAVIRYVEGCGFRLSQVQYLYHRWLDEERGAPNVKAEPALVNDADADERIPFNRPSLQGREIEFMRAAVEHGHTSADGPFAARASELLRDELGVRDVLLTTSCTAALEMSALLLDLEPGDTVVVPSFGFVTTALAFARQGARILFCDIDGRTLGLDPSHLDEIMDGSVRAVVPIHYSGVACELDAISSVLDRWPRASLVEDNAHGLFGKYREQPLGTFGRFATLSFHETKNFTCGEGGALLINNEADIDRAHVVYHKGTNRRAFLHGDVDKYSWQDVGSSFGLSDVLAAFLYAQLEQREPIMTKRQRLFDNYYALLAPRAEQCGYRLPFVPADRAQGYHMFYVLLPDQPTRDRVLDAMQKSGLHATFHYVPLHSSDGGRRFAARETECPVTDAVSGRLLRLPFYTDMTDATALRVVDAFFAALDE